MLAAPSIELHAVGVAVVDYNTLLLATIACCSYLELFMIQPSQLNSTIQYRSKLSQSSWTGFFFIAILQGDLES